jgi:small conductance mechanosensitive channel
LKVRSSVIRLVKRAFQEYGISMPDEAREVVFPKGVSVTVTAPDTKAADVQGDLQGKRLTVESLHEELNAVSTKAEAGLYSEADIIEEQARQAQPLKEGENLLPLVSGTSSSETQTNDSKP